MTLEQHDIVAAEIAAIASLNSVEILYLGSHPDLVRMSNQTIAELKKLKTLDKLSVHANVQPTTKWQSLGSLSLLRILSLNGNLVLRQRDLAALGRLPLLEHLEVRGKVVCEDYTWLTELKKLRSLRIDSEDVSRQILSAIQELPNIEDLELGGIALDNDTLLEFSDQKKLKSLDCELAIGCPLGRLALLPNLEHLVATLPSQTECDFTFIRKLPVLKTICVRGCSNVIRENSALREHPTLTSVLLTDVTGVHVILSLKFNK